MQNCKAGDNRTQEETPTLGQVCVKQSSPPRAGGLCASLVWPPRTPIPAPAGGGTCCSNFRLLLVARGGLGSDALGLMPGRVCRPGGRGRLLKTESLCFSLQLSSRSECDVTARVTGHHGRRPILPRAVCAWGASAARVLPSAAPAWSFWAADISPGL